MNFRRAEQQLADLAASKGRIYYSIEYTISSHKNMNSKEQECCVYIDGYDRASSNNWKDALDKMKIQVNGSKKVKTESIEEIR